VQNALLKETTRPLEVLELTLDMHPSVTSQTLN